MKISLLSENLSKKILFVNHAVSSRSQLPILLNLLLRARGGRFTISATDLDMGIEVDVPARIEKGGVAAVSAKTFTELTGTILSEKINLETVGEGLLMVGEGTRTIFQTSPPEEFPELYEEKGREVITLKKEVADRDFSKVVFAASSDQERPALSGVLIREDEDGFLLVATDGYRLSLEKKALKGIKKKSPAGEKTEPISMIVPSRVIREVIQMGKGDGEVAVCVSEEKNQVIFSAEDTVLVGRLIEAEFPNFEKIIPTGFSTKTAIERLGLQKAVKACYVFARQTAGIIKFSVKKNMVIISANAPSVGSNVVEVEAKTTGEENEIAFNARYVLDFLANTASEIVSFEMTGHLNPGVFREEGIASFMHLIMPIRVQQGE